MLDSIDPFCAYLRRVSGLVIDVEKIYLIESRVVPIMKREKLANLAELMRLLESGRAQKLAQEVIQAMTINETYFFRDKTPFDVFGDVMLPRLDATKPKSDPIRIWCAASSSGQEPYSIAMIAEEKRAQFHGRKIDILATDLAEHILVKARSATYSEFEVQRGLTPERLKRHFTKSQNAWQLNATIRSRVAFQSCNLLSEYAALGSFDVIFCRNVLIYFDMRQKSDILRRLSLALAPGGYIVLGSSESIIGTDTDLEVDPMLKCVFRSKGQVRHAPSFATQSVATARVPARAN